MLDSFRETYTPLVPPKLKKKKNVIQSRDTVINVKHKIFHRIAFETIHAARFARVSHMVLVCSDFPVDFVFFFDFINFLYRRQIENCTAAR